MDLPQPGAIRKFFSVPGDAAIGPVKWIHNADMLPFRGAAARVPWITTAQLEHAVATCDFHALTFKLWEPDELRRYETIQDRIVAGWYALKYVERHWQADKAAPIVYMEWVERYNELPPHVLHPGGAR